MKNTKSSVKRNSAKASAPASKLRHERKPNVNRKNGQVRSLSVTTGSALSSFPDYVTTSWLSKPEYENKTVTITLENQNSGEIVAIGTRVKMWNRPDFICAYFNHLLAMGKDKGFINSSDDLKVIWGLESSEWKPPCNPQGW